MTTTTSIWAIPSATVALFVILTGIWRVAKKYLGRRWMLRRNLRKLACGTDFAYFESLLGQPLATDKDGDRVRRVYRSPFAFVAATAPSTDQSIDSFSITIRNRTRRRRFRFRTGILTVNSLDVDLSRAHFSDVSEPPIGRRCIIGARRYGYAELFNFGNPGHYQLYVLACNDGAGDLFGYPPEFPSFSTGLLADQTGFGIVDDEPASELLTAARRSLRVNTLMVIGPQLGPEAFPDYSCMGFDQDTVRQIPE